MTLARRIGPRAAVLLVAAAVSLLLAEMVVRLLEPEVAYAYRPQRVRADYYAESSLTEFTLRPSYAGRQVYSALDVDVPTTTNSFGWRDAEPDGRPRVLVFGDSFVFGYLLADGDTIPDVLERLGGGAIDFVNLGFTAGRSPDSYAVYLRHHPELHGRDTLVVLFENDLFDARKNRYVDVAGRDVDYSDAARVVCDRLVIRGGNRFDLVSDDDWVRKRLPVGVLATMKRSYLLGLARDRLAGVRATAREPSSGNGPRSRAVAAPERAPRLIRALEELEALSSRLVVVTIGAAGFYESVRELTRTGGLPLIEVPLFDERHRYPGDGHHNREGAAKAATLIHGRLKALGVLDGASSDDGGLNVAGGPP